MTGCRARWKGTAAEVAAEADVLITVLPGPDEVRDVMVYLPKRRPPRKR